MTHAIKDMHWLVDMIQTIDVGILVLDRDYRIQAWNGFLENHSGQAADAVKGQILFDIFPEIDSHWFQIKAEPVFELKTRAFSNWEQRPYLLKFLHYRPITGMAEFMYQNIAISPLTSLTGQVDQLVVLIYDVTDYASQKLQLMSANDRLTNLAISDELTGLHTRRVWQNLVENEYNRFIRHQRPATLVLIDIDNFSSINDRFGRRCGDEVIRDVGHIIQENLRSSDQAGRFDSDEFGLLLTDTCAQQAEVLLSRIKQQISQLSLILNSQKITVSATTGISECHSEFLNIDEWINAAEISQRGDDLL